MTRKTRHLLVEATHFRFTFAVQYPSLRHASNQWFMLGEQNLPVRQVRAGRIEHRPETTSHFALNVMVHTRKLFCPRLSANSPRDLMVFFTALPHVFPYPFRFWLLSTQFLRSRPFPTGPHIIIIEYKYEM